MPLIQSPELLAASRIVDLVQNTRAHYGVCVGLLNSVTTEILALGNEDLAAFGNALGPAEMQALTTAHGQQGEAVNLLLAGVNGILAQSGIEPVTTSVDVRSLTEKLADQGREILMTDGVFSVAEIQA